MIKYVSIPEKRMTIAILENTQYCAIEYLDKMCDRLFANGIYAGPTHSKYKMPNQFKAYARCHPEDEWNEEEGKRIAKERLMKNYYLSFDNRIAMFHADLEESYQNFMKNT